MPPSGPAVYYAKDLRGPVKTSVNGAPKAKVHSSEWARLMNGDPVEINPSTGTGMRVGGG
jgi:hypothetical protein